MQQIQASWGVFAAILTDRPVVTLGQRSGGDSRGVQNKLKGVRQIQASECAFAVVVLVATVVPLKMSSEPLVCSVLSCCARRGLRRTHASRVRGPPRGWQGFSSFGSLACPTLRPGPESAATACKAVPDLLANTPGLARNSMTALVRQSGPNGSCAGARVASASVGRFQFC